MVQAAIGRKLCLFDRRCAAIALTRQGVLMHYNTMIEAFTRSLGQLTDRAILKILAKSALVTGLFFLGLHSSLFSAMMWWSRLRRGIIRMRWCVRMKLALVTGLCWA
jgi:hypothetical protein